MDSCELNASVSNDIKDCKMGSMRLWDNLCLGRQYRVYCEPVYMGAGWRSPGPSTPPYKFCPGMIPGPQLGLSLSSVHTPPWSQPTLPLIWYTALCTLVIKRCHRWNLQFNKVFYWAPVCQSIEKFKWQVFYKSWVQSFRSFYAHSLAICAQWLTILARVASCLDNCYSQFLGYKLVTILWKDDLDSPQVQADTDLITHEDQADHGEKNNSLTYGG